MNYDRCQFEVKQIQLFTMRRNGYSYLLKFPNKTDIFRSSLNWNITSPSKILYYLSGIYCEICFSVWEMF